MIKWITTEACYTLCKQTVLDVPVLCSKLVLNTRTIMPVRNISERAALKPRPIGRAERVAISLMRLALLAILTLKNQSQEIS